MIKPSKNIISPVTVIFFISITVIFIGMFLNHRYFSYNSDSVSLQNILLTWSPFSGHEASLAGTDTFVLKMPILSLLNVIFGPSRRLLFVESYIFNIIAFSLFYFSSLYFLKKSKIDLSFINLLPFIWLASIGISLTEISLNPITRNFELGISFITFVLAAKLYYKEFKISNRYIFTIMSLVTAFLFGVIIYSDAYFLYFTIIPILALFSLLLYFRKISKRCFLYVLIMAILSLFFSRIFGILINSAGAYMAYSYPISFVDFNKIYFNLSLTIEGLLIMFGADFFGKNVFQFSTIVALLNFVIIAFVVYMSRKYSSFKEITKNNRYLWTSFYSFLSLFVIFIYLMCSIALDLGTYRYMIIIIFAGTLLMSFAIGIIKKNRYIFATIVILSIICNILLVVFISNGKIINSNYGAKVPINISNKNNYSLIETIRVLNIKKGYSNYWDGSINTYLSKGDIQFLPVICNAGKTFRLHLLVDNLKFSEKSETSFYIYNPEIASPPVCSYDQIITQFGQPIKIIPFMNSKIMVYNYDLLSNEANF